MGHGKGPNPFLLSCGILWWARVLAYNNNCKITVVAQSQRGYFGSSIFSRDALVRLLHYLFHVTRKMRAAEKTERRESFRSRAPLSASVVVVVVRWENLPPMLCSLLFALDFKPYRTREKSFSLLSSPPPPRRMSTRRIYCTTL